MALSVRLLVFLLGAGLAAAEGPAQDHAATIRLFLNEVQPGTLSTEQYCTLVFADHHFHSEKAILQHGKDSDRRIYEGALSDADWDALNRIVDANDFRELKVPPSVAPLVVQDTHPYTISVARDGKFQNIEFLNSKSLKPYEPQIKPLLQWWKSVRGRRVAESNAPSSANCSLDNKHAVINQ